MTDIRAQVVLQGGSMLPEDRFVNTYHFVRLDSVSDAADVLTPHFEAIYDVLGPNICGYVDRDVTVRYYDLADLEPRVPEIRTFTMPAVGVGNPLPLEACMVVSFHGSPPITGRRRGRVFIGPLGPGALEPGTDTVPPSVSSALISATATAFGVFLAEGNGWRIRSTVPTENFVPVVGGWIDNEFDTQRSRGVTATERLVWP